jgi:hypothetical protein
MDIISQRVRIKFAVENPTRNDFKGWRCLKIFYHCFHTAIYDAQTVLFAGINLSLMKKRLRYIND